MHFVFEWRESRHYAALAGDIGFLIDDVIYVR